MFLCCAATTDDRKGQTREGDAKKKKQKMLWKFQDKAMNVLLLGGIAGMTNSHPLLLETDTLEISEHVVSACGEIKDAPTQSCRDVSADTGQTILCVIMGTYQTHLLPKQKARLLSTDGASMGEGRK